MSTKLRATTRYLMVEQLQLLWRTYAALLLAFVIAPFLFALLTGNIGHYSFVSSLTDLGIGVVFGFFIFVTMALTYDNFKLFIQNGISRKTYWRAKVITLISLSFGAEIVSALYNYLITAPAHNLSAQTFLNQSTYSLYAHFLGPHLFANILGGMFFNWIFFIGLGLTGMAIGSIFALLTKFVRRITIIMIPILGFFLLVFVTRTTGGYSGYNLVGLENFIKFLVGYNATGQAGYFNPTMPIITMLVGCLIMGAIAYFFNQKLKLKK